MASTHNKKANKKQISHYVLDKLLVKQIVSAIYLARDEKTGDAVFLVTLLPDAAVSTDLSERFLRRAETLSLLKHETLLPVQDHGLDGKRPYAVMPYRSGHFLTEQLANSTVRQDEIVDKTEVVASLNLVKQLADGLSAAHPNGLFHHDLRPKNIYLDESGQPYLLDLVVPPVPAVASQVEKTPSTELDYQSPEQIAGKTLSGRSNIFSLGVLLYRLLAGQKPALPVSEWDIFEHKGLVREEPLNQVRPGLAEETYTAVQDSIWQKEWSRYETVEAQIKAIEQAVAAELAPPPPPLPLWQRVFNQLQQPETRRFFIPAAAVLLLLILALVFIQGRADRQGNATPTPDAVTLPQETEPAVLIEPEETATDEPTSTPAMTATADDADTESEGDVLPTTEETETPTTQPSPTTTAVPATPTESALTATLPATPTETNTPTQTPTLEPTASGCIPSPPFGWVRYSIQPNDSLSALSQATNTTVERLIEVNCLETILLSIGQEIWIPALPTPTPTPTVTTTVTPVSSGNNPPPPTAEPPTAPPLPNP